MSEPPAEQTQSPSAPAAPAQPAAQPPVAPAQPSQQPAQQPAQPAQPVVPESYAYKLPEGSQLDAKALDSFTPTFKELGLTQESAQKLVSAYATQLQTAHEQRLKEWGDQARADKDLGGPKFDQNLQVAQSAIARFTSPEFKSWLDQTGLGNHPEMLRAFHKIGKAISEDAPPSPGNPAVQRTAKDVYSHPTSQAVLK